MNATIIDIRPWFWRPGQETPLRLSVRITKGSEELALGIMGMAGRHCPPGRLCLHYQGGAFFPFGINAFHTLQSPRVHALTLSNGHAFLFNEIPLDQQERHS